MKKLMIVAAIHMVFATLNWGESNAYLRNSPLENERANQHSFALQAAILGPIATITVARVTDFPEHGFRWW